jgi:hypothetical protein
VENKMAHKPKKNDLSYVSIDKRIAAQGYFLRKSCSTSKCSKELQKVLNKFSKD